MVSRVPQAISKETAAPAKKRGRPPKNAVKTPTSTSAPKSTSTYAPTSKPKAGLRKPAPAIKATTPRQTIGSALTGGGTSESGFKLAKKLAIVSLAEAQRDKDDVQLFVVNISDQSSTDHRLRKHAIDLGINGSNSDLLVLEATWIPQEITSHQRIDVLASPNFRRALSANLIRIVDTQMAMDIIATRDAQDEMRRLKIDATAEDDDKLLAGAASVITEQNVEDNKISISVADVMRRPDLTPRIKLAQLKNLERSMSSDDLHYVVRICTVNEKVIAAWANGIREERKAKRGLAGSRGRAALPPSRRV